MLIQSRVVVFPIPLSQSQSHSEVDDSFDSCSDAFVHYGCDVLLSIINEREDGSQPDYCGDTSFLHLFKHFYPALCITDVRLQYAAQIIIVSSKRDLHHTFCGPVYLVKKIDILKYAVGLCLYCCPESIFTNDLKAFSCQA